MYPLVAVVVIVSQEYAGASGNSKILILQHFPAAANGMQITQTGYHQQGRP